MTRLLIGVMMAGIGVVTPAAAQPQDPEITTVRENGRVTITLHAGALTVTQTLTRTAVDLRLVHDGDFVQFSGDLEGRVAVQRGGRHRAFSVRMAVREDQEALNTILAASPALDAFDALLASSWAGSAETAVIFRSTREVIRVLQGDHTAVAQMTGRPAVATASVMPVRQRPSPSQCWNTYARDVIHFTYELQSCLNSASYSWNPLATAWCAYEYNLKSSLASIWLLDCYGVPV